MMMMMMMMMYFLIKGLHRPPVRGSRVAPVHAKQLVCSVFVWSAAVDVLLAVEQ